jgi:hypothetical protein
MMHRHHSSAMNRLLLGLVLAIAPGAAALAESQLPDAELLSSSFESEAASWVRNLYRPTRPTPADPLSDEAYPAMGMSIPLSDHASLRLGAETRDLDVEQLRGLDVDVWHLGYRFTWD